MKLLYQFTPEEFEDHLIATGISKKPRGMRSEKARYDFERLVVERGYSFHASYNYVNNATKVSLVCSKGHEYKVSPGSFKSGASCIRCYGKCKENAQKTLIKEVERRGYKLGEDYEYVNGATKVSLICPKGHEYKVLPGSFKSGSSCQKCYGKCKVQAEARFRSVVIERGYKLAPGFIYINSLTKVNLICPEGHIYSVIPNSFKKGTNCISCHRLKIANK